MRRRGVTAAILGLLVGSPAVFAGGGPQFTTEFALENCSFTEWAGNKFFSLQPGHELELEGDDDGTLVQVEIEATRHTKTVSFTTPSGKRLRVRTRVVTETEFEDGELVEVSRNFFALCRQTNDVFYFGEEVDNYEDGEIVDHDGSWLAGVAGAQPGLIMPGRFLLGSRYLQEQAPGVATDAAENVAMGLTVEVPFGTFRNCVEVLDTNLLNPGSGSDQKIYCPGIGLVVDEAVELVDFDRPCSRWKGDCDDDDDDDDD